MTDRARIEAETESRVLREIVAALREREDEGDYKPRGEAGEGWVRVGRFDRARRRALWVRIKEKDDGSAEQIEMCSGREGDDAYVVLRPDNPAWADLEDCILRATYDADASGSALRRVGRCPPEDCFPRMVDFAKTAGRLPSYVQEAIAAIGTR